MGGKARNNKFLGVIIDENLKWDVHTKYLNSKLKCEIGKLNRIKKCIPKIAYKELYHTLFESHLSYGISAWGGISFKKLEPLFITQKKVLKTMKHIIINLKLQLEFNLENYKSLEQNFMN